MRSKSSVSALHDIAQNCALAQKFVADHSLTSFISDTRSIYAVIRCLEIISEASRRLPEPLKQRHVNIPWQDIAAAGNIYRHEYGDVSEEMIWLTVIESLPALAAVVEDELKNPE